MASKKRKRKKKQIRKSGSFDYTMLFITAVLIGIGLVMIYSTSGYASEMKGGDSMAYFKKQASWVAVGFGLMIASTTFRTISGRTDWLRWVFLGFRLP